MRKNLNVSLLKHGAAPRRQSAARSKGQRESDLPLSAELHLIWKIVKPAFSSGRRSIRLFLSGKEKAKINTEPDN